MKTKYSCTLRTSGLEPLTTEFIAYSRAEAKSKATRWANKTRKGWGTLILYWIMESNNTYWEIGRRFKDGWYEKSGTQPI